MAKADLHELINDRLEGWELAEMLGISALEICQEFEDKLQEKLEEIKDLIGLDEDDGDDEDEEEIFE